MKAASPFHPAPAQSKRSHPAEWACLAVIVLAGAVLRAVYFRALLHWPYHREALIVGDGRVYYDAALQILHGSPWGVPVSWQDPFYPSFLALVMKLTGSDLVAPLAVQHLLGLLASVLAWAIARRMAGPVAGLVAAAFVALSPVAVYYEGLLEKSAPGIFLFALAAWLFATGLARGSNARVAGAGAALALTALLRGNTLLVLPVAALAILLARPRPSSAWKAVLAFAIGLALVFVPAILRNHFIRGSYALTAGQGGANFWVGNNPGNSTGTFQSPPFLRDDPRFEEEDWRAEAERRAGRMLDGGEVSRFWFRQGLRYWWTAPISALHNTERKALLFFSAIELPDTQSFRFFRDHFAVLTLPLPGMGPVCVLALLGVALSLRKWRSRAAELALLSGYAASVILFFVLGRYRIIAFPVLVAFAGVGAEAVLGHSRRLEARRLAAIAAGLVAATVLVYRAQAPRRYAFPYVNIALRLALEGRDEEASAQLAEVFRIDPDSVPGRELEARLAMTRGDLATADAALARALKRMPKRRSLRIALALLREQQGRRAEAIALLQKLSEEYPFDAIVRRELARMRGAGRTP
jgi:4-amino-4-deoxy-L-arabinose transferase-like glycosyltransferase